MKKIISFFSVAAVLSAGLLAGCGGSEPAQDTSTPPSMTENVTVSTISLPGEASEDTSTISVQVTEQSLTEGEVVLGYPQLRDFADANSEKTANTLIQQDAKAYTKHHLQDKNGKPLKLEGVLESTVIPHRETISVVTTGKVIQEDKSKEMVVYTTNLSLVSGARISTGVREHAKSIAAQIADGKITPLTADQEQNDKVEAYLQKLGKDKLIALLERCDFTDTDDDPACFSYFMDEDTDDIGIYLPVSKKLGSYALVLVKAERLA